MPEWHLVVSPSGLKLICCESNIHMYPFLHLLANTQFTSTTPSRNCDLWACSLTLFTIHGTVWMPAAKCLIKSGKKTFHGRIINPRNYNFDTLAHYLKKYGMAHLAWCRHYPTFLGKEKPLKITTTFHKKKCPPLGLLRFPLDKTLTILIFHHVPPWPLTWC